MGSEKRTDKQTDIEIASRLLWVNGITKYWVAQPYANYFIHPSSVAYVRFRITNNWLQYILFMCVSLLLFFLSLDLFGFCSEAKKLYNWLFSWLFIVHVRDWKRTAEHECMDSYVWTFDFHLDTCVCFSSRFSSPRAIVCCIDGDVAVVVVVAAAFG